MSSLNDALICEQTSPIKLALMCLSANKFVSPISVLSFRKRETILFVEYAMFALLETCCTCYRGIGYRLEDGCWNLA